VTIQSPPEIFARMLTNEAFDVSAMSMAHSLIHRGKAGIRRPKDLEGRRMRRSR